MKKKMPKRITPKCAACAKETIFGISIAIYGYICRDCIERYMDIAFINFWEFEKTPELSEEDVEYIKGLQS